MTHRLRQLLFCATTVAGLVLAGRGALPVQAALTPPADIASYAISARYEPGTHRITAEETAVYRNLADDPIPDLVFHLYLNAFRSQDTLWMQEAGLGYRGFAYKPDEPGWIEVANPVLSDGTPLTLTAIDDDATLVRAELPRAVAHGEAITVTLTFEAQLPRVFARTGWADGGDFVMAGQWFPKLGVWEEGSWNAYPFHANSEFYADFGSYAVDLTLPAGWVVGSTGIAAGAPQTNADGSATQSFVAEHVIDFAWAASPHFRETSRDLDDVRLRVLAYPDQRSTVRRVLDATTDAYELYSDWYAPYGQGLYPQLTVIVVPPSAGGAGGMEYPTLFTVGALAGGGQLGCYRMLEVETVHELAHQWFQSMLATNEAEEPWLDEGFADYSTTRAMTTLYNGIWSCGGWTYSYLGLRRTEYRLMPDVPMAGAAWDFGMEYSIATYSKPALALTMLERQVGEEAMVTFLREYTARHAFTHPDADDLRGVMADTLGAEIADGFFEGLVYGSATIDMQVQGANSTADGSPEVLLTMMREGELCVPSSVSVDPAGSEGPSESAWPCPDAMLPLVAREPESVVIDPETVVMLDRNLENNGWRKGPDWAGWLGVWVRLLRFVQGVLGGGVGW